MNSVQHFFAGTFIYIAFIVFFIECVIQFFRYSKKYKNGTLQPGYLNPNKSNKLSLVADICWHLALVVLVFGHSRMIGDFQFIFNFVSYEFMNASGHIMGCILGTCIAIAFIYFLIKRIQQKSKFPIHDFVFLGLALVLITLGNILQYSQPFSLELYREYISSVLHFSPAFPAAVNGTFANLLTIHVTIACTMLIFFPWSQVVEHMLNRLYQKKHANNE